MSPTAMLTLMFAAIAMFSWSASRRWQLLQIGRPASASITSTPACAERGGTRFARRRWTTTTPRGWPISSSSSASSSCSSARSSSGAAATTPPFDLFVLNPSTAARGGLRVSQGHHGARSSSAARSSFSTTGSSSSRSACRSARGRPHPLIIFTMMVADMIYDGASLVLASKAGRFLHGRHARRRTVGQCAAMRPSSRRSATSAWQGSWSLWPAPAGSFFASFFARAVAGGAHLASRAPASGRTRRCCSSSSTCSRTRSTSTSSRRSRTSSCAASCPRAASSRWPRTPRS